MGGEKAISSQVDHYRNRAMSLFHAMKLLAYDLDAFAHAACILAVHCAISLADAVLVHRTGRRSREKGHEKACDLPRRACSECGIDSSGVKHLAFLLSKKNKIEYGETRLDMEGDVRRAIIAAERVAAWALRAFPELDGANR